MKDTFKKYFIHWVSGTHRYKEILMRHLIGNKISLSYGSIIIYIDKN